MHRCLRGNTAQQIIRFRAGSRLLAALLDRMQIVACRSLAGGDRTRFECPCTNLFLARHHEAASDFREGQSVHILERPHRQCTVGVAGRIAGTAPRLERGCQEPLAHPRAQRAGFDAGALAQFFQREFIVMHTAKLGR